MSEITPLPQAFTERVGNDPFLGKPLLDALETVPPVSVRLNPLKHSSLQNSSPIPWSTNGVWLAERPVFTLDPSFHAGAYYPQEAGSQLLDTVLRQLDLPEQPVCLDLCAAPGGKSTLIANFLGESGLLVANEIIPNRAKILHENLTKWGAKHAVVTNNASEDFAKLGSFFDLIVIDAPCSGEGMFRKDHGARNEWSEQNVGICTERQQEIVENAWECLKKDGYIVYSTCTFNASENEENVQWFADQYGAEIVAIKLPAEFVSRNGIGAYALPNKVDTEGFFIAVLRKHEDTGTQKQKKNKKSAFSPILNAKDTAPFVTPTATHEVVLWKERYWSIPIHFEQELIKLVEALRAFKLCVCVGELSRKGLIPDENLAFVPGLVPEGIPRIELSKEQALHYLKGDTFQLPRGNGFALVCFEGNQLGWIKLIDNRFNNLYPKEWRIRMRID